MSFFSGRRHNISQRETAKFLFFAMTLYSRRRAIYQFTVDIEFVELIIIEIHLYLESLGYEIRVSLCINFLKKCSTILFKFYQIHIAPGQNYPNV